MELMALPTKPISVETVVNKISALLVVGNTIG
jgi:hypothetical protein